LLGYLGSLVFSVSADNAKTFDALQRGASARWAEHQIHGKKPVLEFIGPDADSLSFTMRLDIAHGVNPLEEIADIREFITTGEVLPLVLGERFIGDFVIKSFDEAWTRIDGRGNVLIADISVTLQEHNYA
jgi:phage protein U